MRYSVFAISLISTLVLTTIVHAAPTPAYTVSGTPTTAAGGWNTKGLSFQVTQPITVKELAFYGNQLGGGDTPAVQIWDSTNTSSPLLTASFGTGAFVGWKYVSVADTLLSPGTMYVVSGPCWWASTVPAANIGFASEVTPLSWTTGTASGWTSETYSTTAQSDQSNPIFLASFTFVSVPEPGSFGLLAAGALLGLCRVRRRKV